MVTGEEGERGDNNLICNVPVRSQTKPCMTEILPLFLFLFHSMWKGKRKRTAFHQQTKHATLFQITLIA